MAQTQLKGTDIGDGAIGKVDLNTTSTGQAVIARIVEVANTGIKINASTGVDAGTGDVSLALDWTKLATLYASVSHTHDSYLLLAGGTLTGALGGTSATFSGSITATTGNFKVPANSDSKTAGANTGAGLALLSANGLYGLFGGVSSDGHVWLQTGRNDADDTLYDFKIQTLGGRTLFGGSATAINFIKSGGTSAQFLKADGSVDASMYLTALHAIGVLTGQVWGYDSHPSTTSGYGLPAYPTTLPASDVYAWAKAETKPSYTYTEVGAQIAGTYATGGGSATGTNTGDNAANTLYSGLVSFPGFGTTHITAAYGDHAHSGAYQPVLVSTANIKSVNGNSLLGAGNLTISGSGVGLSYNPTVNYPVNVTGNVALTGATYTWVGNIVHVAIDGNFTSTTGGVESYFYIDLPVSIISLGSASGVGSIWNNNGGTPETYYAAARVELSAEVILFRCYPVASAGVIKFSLQFDYDYDAPA